jgi:hypothetical protein
MVTKSLMTIRWRAWPSTSRLMAILTCVLFWKSCSATRTFVKWMIRMALRLVCSCGWSKSQEGNDPTGAMLKILKDIHESTFTGHKATIEEG